MTEVNEPTETVLRIGGTIRMMDASGKMYEATITDLEDTEPVGITTDAPRPLGASESGSNDNGE